MVREKSENDPPAATANALLASARRLFARRGFDGASIRAITHDAGANLGAVTYHFGSKNALYEAMLDQVLAPLAIRVARVAVAGTSPLERIDAVVRALFEHLQENPDMPQLMLQEMAAGKDPPPPVHRALGGVSGTLRDLVSEGQRAGEIREGDPLLLGLSCVYQPVHLTLIRRMARSIMGVDMADPDTHERIVEHAVRFVRAGLASRRETTS